MIFCQACYWYQQGCSIGCPTCDSVSGRVQVDICGLGKQATVNKPALRTVNRAAPAGSKLGNCTLCSGQVRILT